MFLTAAPLQQLVQVLPEWIRRIPVYLKTLIDWVKLDLNPWFKIVPILLIGMKGFITYIDSVQKEQARIQGEKDVLIKQVKQKTESEAQDVAQLRLQVEEERRRLGLNVQHPSLLDFVNARLSGNDYGKQLGRMQQVKQDLIVLSSRLTVGKHNQRDLEKLFPRGPARIVLFIDDLDRCPPDRVVEVLEAIQLLLNTELFVVILAIDDRYVARALEQVYKGVLKRRGKPSGIDYLEKIIQIPYRMRSISSDTVEDYFRSQLNIKESESSTAKDSIDSSPSRSTVLGIEDLPTKNSSSRSEIESSSISKMSERDIDSTDDTFLLVEEESEKKSESMNRKEENDSSELSSPNVLDNLVKTPIETKNSKIKQLSYQEQEQVSYIEMSTKVEEVNARELKLLVDCCKYVDITPRTGKRLINVYKILLIIWKTRNKKIPSQPLPNDQEKRVVISFLVLSGRYPDFMRSLFEEINILFSKKSYKMADEETSKNPKISDHLDEIIKRIAKQFNSSNQRDFHSQREWKRFILDIKYMLKDPNQSFDHPVTLNLDRRTFSLMLSFCFVGDLGYDPGDLLI